MDIVYKTRHCQDIVANSRMFEPYLLVLPVKCYQGVQKWLRCNTNWILLVIFREGLIIYEICLAAKIFFDLGLYLTKCQPRKNLLKKMISTVLGLWDTLSVFKFLRI